MSKLQNGDLEISVQQLGDGARVFIKDTVIFDLNYMETRQLVDMFLLAIGESSLAVRDNENKNEGINSCKRFLVEEFAKYGIVLHKNYALHELVEMASAVHELSEAWDSVKKIVEGTR